MPKPSIRVISLLVIPSLIGDPALAAAMSPSSAHMQPGALPAFREQALTPHLIAAFRKPFDFDALAAALARWIPQLQFADGFPRTVRRKQRTKDFSWETYKGHKKSWQERFWSILFAKNTEDDNGTNAESSHQHRNDDESNRSIIDPGIPNGSKVIYEGRIYIKEGEKVGVVVGQNMKAYQLRGEGDEASLTVWLVNRDTVQIAKPEYLSNLASLHENAIAAETRQIEDGMNQVGLSADAKLDLSKYPEFYQRARKALSEGHTEEFYRMLMQYKNLKLLADLMNREKIVKIFLTGGTIDDAINNISLNQVSKSAFIRLFHNEPENIYTQLNQIRSIMTPDEIENQFDGYSSLKNHFWAWVLDPTSWCTYAREYHPREKDVVTPDKDWMKVFSKWGNDIINTLEIGTGAGTEYQATQSWTDVIGLIEKIKQQGPEFESKLPQNYQHLPDRGIRLLYVLFIGSVPDIQNVSILYHGSPLDNIKRMIFDAGGYLDAASNYDLMGNLMGHEENYLSFNRNVSNHFARSDGFVLEFDAAQLLLSKASFELGRSVIEEELIFHKPIPLKYLTKNSKRQLVTQFRSDTETNEVIATSLGYDSYEELLNDLSLEDSAGAWLKTKTRWYERNWSHQVETRLFIPLMSALLVFGPSMIGFGPVSIGMGAFAMGLAFIFGHFAHPERFWNRSTWALGAFTAVAGILMMSVLRSAAALSHTADPLQFVIAIGFIASAVLATEFVSHLHWHNNNVRQLHEVLFGKAA